jgi:hypothetical protein
MIAAAGHADKLPAWPEMSTVAVNVDGRTWTLPDHRGEHLEPRGYEPPPAVLPSRDRPYPA